MKNPMRNLFLITGSLMVLLNPRYSHSPKKPYLEGIIKTIKNELRIEENYPLPEIKTIERQELQSLFKENTSKSLEKWTQHFGEKKAKEIMKKQLEDITGFYTPGINVLYIGNFLKGCERKGAIAHELTHYFQTMKKDQTYRFMFTQEELHFHHELEANKIEKIIYNECCRE